MGFIDDLIVFLVQLFINVLTTLLGDAFVDAIIAFLDWLFGGGGGGM